MIYQTVGIFKLIREGNPSRFFIKGVIFIDTIENLPNEGWRDIEGYNGKYLVSNMGRIKSLQTSNAKLLTAFVNNKGYERVALSKEG